MSVPVATAKSFQEASCACWKVISAIGFLIVLLSLAGCDRAGPDRRLDNSGAGSVPGQGDLKEARRMISEGRFDEARNLIDQCLLRHPDDPQALEMAGDGAIQAKDYASAIQYFESAVKATKNPSNQLWYKLAGATTTAERPFKTIGVLRNALKTNPDDLRIRQNLATWLARVGLQYEAADHLQWLVQRQHGDQSVLYILTDLTRPHTHDPTCQSALLRNPDDLRPMFSMALPGIEQSNWRELRDAVSPVVEKHPDFTPASAFYGRALVELGEQDLVEQWSRSLGPKIESQPQYWLAAGNWAYRHGSIEQAARAFWSAVRLNENDSEALLGLSLCLSRLGCDDEAKLAARRAEKIGALRSHLDNLSAWEFDSQKSVVDLALTMDDLGRRWEAVHWLMIGYSMQQNPDPRLDQTYRRLRKQITVDTPWQMPDRMVSNKIDLSSFPKFEWSTDSKGEVSPGETSSQVSLQFRDEAESRQLRHVCAIGKSGDREAGLMIYQSGAGGVGVVDYDLDGWPDNYLTIMDGTPNRQDSRANRLYRNLEGRFGEVTEVCQLFDRGFAQGVSVGDYNSDGWADIFVANIGQNRLYRNNGDGTFSDVTLESKLSGSGWTTSVAIADIDQDGHADLYEVGYCSGESPIRRECLVEETGEIRSCNPMSFDAEQDRIWTGNGDGTFTEATKWFGPHDAGRGFALVIGDLDQKPGLETYVANDMTANHYWAGSSDSGRFQLSEQASLRGLAFNRRSNAQASMGIAAADADQDGDIDFLLTHFVEEYNTFYRQELPGIWMDDSIVSGFADASKPMLAYGTQWIDVDNDGFLEAFIANGDIDDFQFNGRAFRQPAQLFRSDAGRRWKVMPPDQPGDYFSKNRLARAVATLDANRDGLTDLLVTHLFDPVALLINRSETSHRQTRFFLRARTTHRDAIGTRIGFTVDGRVVEQQLLAGNGFQCCNEACVVFGVSDAQQLEQVQVIWPQGRNESLGDLPAGFDYLVVEGLGASQLNR